jgi:hypothetical protein
MSKYAAPNFPALFTEAFDKLRDFDKKLIQSLGGLTLTLKAILDRGISFDDNVDCRRVSVTSHATPGTEFSVTNTLGKVPVGYIVYGQNAAGNVYDGTTANTATTLYLKSDVSSKTFRLLIF